MYVYLCSLLQQTKPDGSLSLIYKVPTTHPGEEPSAENIQALIEEARSTFLAQHPPPLSATTKKRPQALKQVAAAPVEEDDDYYYYDDDDGGDRESELNALTVTSGDEDEYYDYQDYNDIISQNTFRRRRGHKSEVLTPQQHEYPSQRGYNNRGFTRKTFSYVDRKQQPFPNWDRIDEEEGKTNIL